MYSYTWPNGILRLDHDYFFDSNWVCWTLINAEYDRDKVTNDYTVSIGLVGLHLTVVWR
jgi:hypothetical protein